jgi:hypothetical protein
MGAPHPSDVAADPPGPGWTVVWDDEFNLPPGSLPNPAMWATCPVGGCGPPPGRFAHYAESEGLLGYFDGQSLELYVDECTPSTTFPGCVEGVPYASGAIRSRARFRYGYMEIRWNLTLLSGEHPDFWMLPAQGGPQDEIDVAEFAGDDLFTVHMALHWHDEQRQASKTFRDGTDWGDSRYHTFAVDWEPDRLTWYIDGHKRRSLDSRHVPDVDMYLLATVQVGGVELAGQPDRYLDPLAAVAIDHIRVWQHCRGSECAVSPMP